jgi:hypothetical protein
VLEVLVVSPVQLPQAVRLGGRVAAARGDIIQEQVPHQPERGFPGGLGRHGLGRAEVAVGMQTEAVVGCQGVQLPQVLTDLEQHAIELRGPKLVTSLRTVPGRAWQ